MGNMEESMVLFQKNRDVGQVPVKDNQIYRQLSNNLVFSLKDK